MAARQEEPKLKGRNLKKSAQKGVRTVQSVALRGKSSTSSQGRTAFNGEEEIPAWEREARQSSTVSMLEAPCGHGCLGSKIGLGVNVSRLCLNLCLA